MHVLITMLIYNFFFAKFGSWLRGKGYICTNFLTPKSVKHEEYCQK